MKNTFYDLDPDVRETARQLAAADFSPQSQQQESLRVHLLERIDSQHSPRTPLRAQSRGRLYAVIGTLAASLIIGMIILMRTSTVPVASVSEEIIPIVPAATSAEASYNASPKFYDSLPYAAAYSGVPSLYAPSELPEGYSLSFVASSWPSMEVHTMTSVYIKKDEWQKSVLKGMTDHILVDYLYIAQELYNEETHLPQWDFPSNFQRTESTFYTTDSPPTDTSVYHGTAVAGPYSIVIWPKDGITFHLASRSMTHGELEAIAQSLQPIPTPNIFISPPDQPGTCDVSGPGDAPFTPWVLPLKKGSYTFERGVYTGHTGVDLLAPQDTPLFAANSGKVVFAGWSEWGYGNTIIISHGEVLSLYAHLNAINVTCNELVQAGQQIGAVGSSGNSSGPHLHFEMRRANDGGSLIDPAQMLDFQPQ